MAKREQIPPFLARRNATQIELCGNTNDDRFSVRRPGTPVCAAPVIVLKAIIGLVTEPYLTAVGYMARLDERNSISGRDISQCLEFVPIRHDPEMVVNLGLPVVEAGLRRLGAAA